MAEIILNDEQARILAEAEGLVELRDYRGKLLGCVAQGISEKDVAVALRSLRSDEPRYTTAQVLAYLESLGNR